MNVCFVLKATFKCLFFPFISLGIFSNHYLLYVREWWWEEKSLRMSNGWVSQVRIALCIWSSSVAHWDWVPQGRHSDCIVSAWRSCAGQTEQSNHAAHRFASCCSLAKYKAPLVLLGAWVVLCWCSQAKMGAQCFQSWIQVERRVKADYAGGLEVLGFTPSPPQPGHRGQEKALPASRMHDNSTVDGCSRWKALHAQRLSGWIPGWNGVWGG